MSRVISELARAIPKESLHWAGHSPPRLGVVSSIEPPQLVMLREDPASGKKRKVITGLLVDSLIVSQNGGAGPITTFHRQRKGGSERELGGDQGRTHRAS